MLGCKVWGRYLLGAKYKSEKCGGAKCGGGGANCGGVKCEGAKYRVGCKVRGHKCWAQSMEAQKTDRKVWRYKV